MLNSMQYNVDEEGNSHFHISLTDFGIEAELCIAMPNPSVSEWDAPTVEVFQADVNLLIEQARGDLHRLIRSTCRNAQLAAFGLAPEFSEEDLDDDLAEFEEPEEPAVLEPGA